MRRQTLLWSLFTIAAPIALAVHLHLNPHDPLQERWEEKQKFQKMVGSVREGMTEQEVDDVIRRYSWRKEHRQNSVVRCTWRDDDTLETKSYEIHGRHIQGGCIRVSFDKYNREVEKVSVILYKYDA